MKCDGDRQIIPAVTSIEEAIVVLVIGTREEHGEATFDSRLKKLEYTRDASEAE